MRKDAPPRTLRAIDYWLLGAALLFGIASTLRVWGVMGVTLPAALLLAGAAALSLVPLARLFRGAPLEKHGRAIVAVVLGAHLLATLFFFPPEDILNGRPILTLDHSLHYYQAERAREVFWRSGRLFMYDPYFMAGHPGGAIFDIDSKGVELWCALLRFIGTPIAFKLFILFGYLLLPLTAYAACRRLRFGLDETLYAVLLLLAYWHWGRPYASHFRFAGMFSYLIVCHLSLYLAGLARAFIDGEPAKRFYFLGPIAFFVHPTAAVLLIAPIIAVLLAAYARSRHGSSTREPGRRTLGRLALWCFFIITANAIWLAPLIRYIDIKVSSETFFQIEGIGALAALLAKSGNIPALLLLALAVAGTAHLARERRLVAGAAPMAGGGFLLLISAFGIYLPLFNQMEPGRFLVPALVFAAPLSGAGLSMILRKAGKTADTNVQTGSCAERPEKSAARPPCLGSAVRPAVLILFLIAAPTLSLVASRSFYRHTLTTTFTPAARELIETLRQHIDPSGRLMIEDGPAWAYGNTFLPALLPLYTRVEQIGGPYPFTFIKHGFATFRTREAFGTQLSEMTRDRLGEYLESYNIRWILTATPECAAAFKDLMGANAVWSSGEFTLWESALKPAHASEPEGGSTTISGGGSGFAWDARAAVRASYDLIHVAIADDVIEPPDSILLKYHWDRGLRVHPPARISPLLRLDDPVPFILLEPNGSRDIGIRFGW